MRPVPELKAILDDSRKYNIWSNPKRKETTDTCDCEYCGRKCGKTPLTVHVTVRGTCLPNDFTIEELESIGEESQGGWSIGSECAKKLFGKDLERYTK